MVNNPQWKSCIYAALIYAICMWNSFSASKVMCDIERLKQVLGGFIVPDGKPAILVTQF